MSVSTFIPKQPLTPQERRDVVRARFAELASKADELTDAEIEAAHNALLELEIQRLSRSLEEGVAEAEAAGMLEPEGIRQSIREHRVRHPYA